MKSIGREVAAVSDCEKEPTESVDLDGTEDETEIPGTQLKNLTAEKASLERHGRLPEAYRKALLDCQLEIGLEKQQNLRQATVVNHFKTK